MKCKNTAEKYDVSLNTVKSWNIRYKRCEYKKRIKKSVQEPIA